jgi:hypothetical protein
MVRAPEEVLSMRLTSILFSMIAATAFSLTACSSGGDDGGGGDDTQDIDAGDIDAGDSPDAPGGGNTATGLGQVCNQQATCPAEASLCAELDNPTNNGGFCTMSCGMTAEPAPGTDPTPPAGGNEMCAAAYNGSSGTPGCILYTAPQAGQITWYCAIGCGNAGGTELGTCPNDLLCNAQNFCDD